MVVAVTSQIWEYKAIEGQWQSKRWNLVSPRHGHDCIHGGRSSTGCGNYVIVVGGQVEDGDFTSSTEILCLNNRHGRAVHAGPMIPIQDGKVANVRLASMYASQEIYLFASTQDHTFLFKWNDCTLILEQCAWISLNKHLQTRRSSFVVFGILSAHQGCRAEPEGEDLWSIDNGESKWKMDQDGKIVNTNAEQDICSSTDKVQGPATLRGN